MQPNAQGLTSADDVIFNGDVVPRIFGLDVLREGDDGRIIAFTRKATGIVDEQHMRVVGAGGKNGIQFLVYRTILTSTSRVTGGIIAIEPKKGGLMQRAHNAWKNPATVALVDGNVRGFAKAVTVFLIKLLAESMEKTCSKWRMWVSTMSPRNVPVSTSTEHL